MRADLVWLEEFLNPQRNLGWLGWFDALEGGQPQRRSDRLQPHLRVGAAGPFHRRQPPGLLGRGRVGSTGRPRRCLHGGTFVAVRGDRTAPNFASESSQDSPSARRVPWASGCRPSRFWSTSQRPDPAAAVLASALEWTEMIVEAATSAVTASWTVDVLQAATTTPQALALDAKSRLFYSALDVLRPVKSSLSLADIEGLRLVAEELATSLPDDFEVQNSRRRPGRPLPAPGGRRRGPLLADGVCDHSALRRFCAD